MRLRCLLPAGWALLAIAGLAISGAAKAGLPLVEQVRHGGADRLIVHAPGDVHLAARQEGGSLVLDLPADAAGVVGPSYGGHWVRGVSVAGGRLRVVLAPGARPRLRMLADRIIIDVDGGARPLKAGEIRLAGVKAAAGATATPLAGAAAAPAGKAKAAPVAAVAGKAVAAGLVATPALVAPAPLVPVVVAAAVAAGNAPLPAAPVQAAAAPAVAAGPAPAPPDPAAAQAASVSLVSDGGGGPAILLPAARLTGAAAFTRGGELRVVLDAPVLLDLSQLKDDPVFGSATERLLPGGSELRLRPPAGSVPRLARRDGGWQLTLDARPAAMALVTGQAHGGILSLAAAQAGRVLAVEDEATGGRLLVGTQRDGGQRVVAGHHAPEFALLPSWQGVVVQPLSDRVRLIGKDAGFDLLAADVPALSLVWPGALAAITQDGRAMTRRFDLPDLPAAMLHARLAGALRDAAVAPLAARTVPRLRLAGAMLACGLDAEAASVLQVAAADDPAVMSVGDPRNAEWQGLSAMATWLAAEAGGTAAVPASLPAAALGDSDEAVLWRSLWGAAADQPAAAAAVGARWRLVLTYPDALRRRMLPGLARLLAQGGQDQALDELLGASTDPALDVVRAGRLQRQGKPAASLALLDRIAAGRDRLARAQAREMATEQRLQAGMLTPAEAAIQLDRQIYAWRGGERELHIRLRAAELHVRVGDWRQALALLHETGTLFPEQAARVHAAELAVVSGLLQGDRTARLGALDLMALADSAANLLGAAQSEAALAPLLADRMLALDLPEQAEPILRRLLDRAAGGPAEAGLGLRLAGLLADRGDAAGATAILDKSGGGAVDAAVAERRALLRAGLLAHAGQPAAALAALESFNDRPAVEAQAGLREAMHDWPGAEHALLGLADGGTLAADARQAIVLRAARDATEAGDMAGLRAMRLADTALFAGSASAGLFAVLTGEPVQHVADLPRAGQELAAARAFSASVVVK